MGYGLNYREQQNPDKVKAYDHFKSGIDKYISYISEKYHKSIAELIPWKVELLKAIKVELEKLPTGQYNNILSKKGNKKDLKLLHDHFVIVPVDKASNNIAIICKKFYIEVLQKELTSSTFNREAITEDSYKRSVNKYLTDYKFPYNTNCQSMPFLYWTAKMHKSPPKFRFITSGTASVLSELSTKITKCLKLLLNTARYLDKYRIKGLDHHIAIIDNRTDVIKFLITSNQMKERHKSISSWDFENLYTNIPHQKLKQKIKHFVFKIFELKDAKFITTNSKRAYFTKTRSKVNVSCNNGVLVSWINYIIDNAYISYNGELFRQIIGIPMGTSCAPYLANLFLHVYEYEYLKQLVENDNLDIAKKLQNLYRYQDDCLSLNDSNLFHEHYSNIYPKELVLKNTNISRDKSTFLDTIISIYRGKFTFKMYDKRNDFNFNVVKFPHLHGKIPRIPSYGVFTSQLLRVCDVNMYSKHFRKDVVDIFKCFKSQGFDTVKLKGYYHKFCDKYYFKWCKFGDDITRLCNNL